MSTVDAVTITDIDQLNFVVSQTSIGPLLEQAAAPAGPGLTPATFTVSLTELLPMGQTVVAKVTSSDTSSVTATFPGSSATCTFSSSVTSCPVTLTVQDDANAANENVTITIADSAGAPPAGLAA